MTIGHAGGTASGVAVFFMPLLEKLGWVLVVLGFVGWIIPRIVKVRSTLGSERELPDTIKDDNI